MHDLKPNPTTQQKTITYFGTKIETEADLPTSPVTFGQGHPIC
jgi:hypothetical protein